MNLLLVILASLSLLFLYQYVFNNNKSDTIKIKNECNKNTNKKDTSPMHVSHNQCSPKYNCVKKIEFTKYDNPDTCDIDPSMPRSENKYAPAERSFGCDQFLDGAHYEYLPGETRSDYHQRWRERVRAELIFHPGDNNYC